MDCLVSLEDVESIEQWIENDAVRHMNDGGVTFPGMAIIIQTLNDKIAELRALFNKWE